MSALRDPMPLLQGEFSVTGAYRYATSSARSWVLSHVARYPGFLVAFFALSLLSDIAFSLAPIVTGHAAEEVLKPGGGRLFERALELLGCLVLSAVCNLGGSFCAENIGKRFQADAREELYVALLAKSQTFHGRQRVGDIIARATDDTSLLSMMIVPGANLIVESTLSIIVPCAFLASIVPQLLIVPGAFLVAHFFAVRAYVKDVNPVMMNQRVQFGALNAGLEETIAGIEVVKASAREGFERQKYGRLARILRDTTVEQGVLEARYLPLLLFALATGGMFLHCLWLYQRGTLGISGVIAAMGLMGVLRFPAFISIFTFSLVQSGFASAQRILAIINAEAELEENAHGHAGPLRGELELQGVSFSYGGRDVLSEVSFRVQPGQTLAIVGQTGAGKTTLTQLVNRIHDPSAGRVLVDGVDARAWSLHALRSGIGKIEQDIFLFSRSIAENIAFGRPSATRAEVEAAARNASAHEFISALPNGYDTVIGQRGVTLSGGQRQRIALARAFLSDPPILILDDSTSAIDSATEEEIQRALRRVQAGRTTLLITHRLSMIRWADVIVVLDRGRLVASGDHGRLLRTCSVYRRIFARYDIELPALEAEVAEPEHTRVGPGNTERSSTK